MKAKPRELLEKEAKLLEYYNDVVHYLRAFNIDENLLEDAIQDTFVEALSSLDTLRDETKDAPALLLTPLAFWLHVPSAVPVAYGLAGISGQSCAVL